MTTDVHTIKPSDQIGFEDRYLIIRKRGLKREYENRKNFTLIPFELNGTVNDAAAIEALKAYAIATTNMLLRSDLLRWIRLEGLHVFEMTDGEYVVAESVEEADQIMKELTGCHAGDGEHDDDCWSQLDDNQDFKIDGVAKPAWQWCIENGKGFLCSDNL